MVLCFMFMFLQLLSLTNGDVVSERCLCCVKVSSHNTHYQHQHSDICYQHYFYTMPKDSIDDELDELASAWESTLR